MQHFVIIKFERRIKKRNCVVISISCFLWLFLGLKMDDLGEIEQHFRSQISILRFTFSLINNIAFTELDIKISKSNFKMKPTWFILENNLWRIHRNQIETYITVIENTAANKLKSLSGIHDKKNMDSLWHSKLQRAIAKIITRIAKSTEDARTIEKLPQEYAPKMVYLSSDCHWRLLIVLVMVQDIRALLFLPDIHWQKGREDTSHRGWYNWTWLMHNQLISRLCNPKTGKQILWMLNNRDQVGILALYIDL